MTDITTILSRARAQRPANEALREWESGRAISYERLDDQCTALALYLRQAGLKPGDRVAIYLPNVIEFVIAQFGILRGGFVATYINDRLAIDEAVRQIQLAAARIVITTKERSEAFQSVAGALDANFIIADAQTSAIGAALSSIVASADSECAPFQSSPDGDALLRFTSGTSGKPKGVIVTHRAWVTRAVQLLAELVKIEEESMVLCPGPLTHAAGLLVLPSFLRCGRLLLMRKFDTEQIGRIAETFPIRYGMFVPTMIKMVLEDRNAVEKLRRSGMKQISYGGSPISAPVLGQALDCLQPITFVQSYGSHEAGTMTFLDHADHRSPRLRESAGKPLLNVEVRVEPSEGHQYGEIVVRTPWSARALLRDDGTMESRGEWVRTGDVGEMKDGYLFLLDRLNGVIVSGSFNVYPAEVERCILRYPGIKDCVVVGVPDEKWGEQVVAYLVGRPGACVEEEALRDHCRQSLAGYKVPKEFVWIERIPLNATGKPDRSVLAASRWEGHHRRIH